MQKRVIFLLTLAFVGIFLFSNFISAIPNYNCNVVPTADCNLANNGYIVMELANYTNSHGQFNQSGVYTTPYDYALCCYYPGTTSCSQTQYNTYYGNPNIPQNKIIGLDSLTGATDQTTNAHGESTGYSNYSVPVCYTPLSGNLQCISTTASSCPTGDVNNPNNNYPYQMLSLVNMTNSHIGNFSAYPVKVCCQIVGSLNTGCTLNSATWQYTNAMDGVQVGLTVTGTDCVGATVSFNVTDGKGNVVSSNPGDRQFSGSNTINSTWTANYNSQSGASNDYKFNAFILYNGQVLTSVNSGDGGSGLNSTLTVSQRPVDFCQSIISCSDYKDAANCTSDASLCNIAPQDAQYDPNAYSSSCQWNSATSTCGLVNEYNGNAAISCGKGFTLCENYNNNNLKYCYPGNQCPGSDQVTGNGDGKCQNTESCSPYNNSECKNFDQASCSLGNWCSGGQCWNDSASVLIENYTTCNNQYTLCHNDAKNLNYCYPGSVCPASDTAPNNSCASGSTSNQTAPSPTSCVGSGVCLKTGETAASGYCSVAGASVGKCVYDFTGTTDTCEGGFLTYQWNATWTGNNQVPSTCKSGKSVIECPASIQLPFFTVYNILATIGVLILIYLAIVFARKKSKSKKVRKKPERKKSAKSKKKR